MVKKTNPVLTASTCGTIMRILGGGLRRPATSRHSFGTTASRIRKTKPRRSYLIPGSYAPALSEKRNSFLRLEVITIYGILGLPCTRRHYVWRIFTTVHFSKLL